MIAFIHILLLISISSASWWTDPKECTCDDRPFFVEYTSSYTRHDSTYGYDVHCHTYLITRSEDYNQHDKCTEQINHVTLGVSTDDCDHQVSDLQHIIVDYGASSVFNCTTQLLRDETSGILGMRYDCDFAPHNDVNIYFCTTIADDDMIDDGHIAYVSNNNYAYTCDDTKVPNFCGEPPDYHPPPVIPPTPKPTWPTRYPTTTPTMDPTGFPTEFPTDLPTRDPTIEPTKYPSVPPTLSPTRDPTTDPTPWPTPEPTRKPTQSPIMPACPIEDATDIVLMVDTSCFNGLNQCNEDQIEFVAELFSAVVGPGNNNRGAYIRFDTNNVYIDIALDDHAYDTLPITQNDINQLYLKIHGLPYTNTGDFPDLDGALTEAYKQFEVVGESDNNNRDKKIIIISNAYCPYREEICGNHETKIRTGLFNPTPQTRKNARGFNVVMVNMGTNAPDNYMMCLVDHDDGKIFDAPYVNLIPELTDLLPLVQTEICEQPTPAPTVVPTRDPTHEPTDFPTDNPSPIPTRDPTTNPTVYPSANPTRDPTHEPTQYPTNEPTDAPTESPTNYPSVTPTIDPTKFPTDFPTEAPTGAPTTWPSPAPTDYPTPSPNMEACENGGRLDIVFLIDTSGVLSPQQCADRNELAGEIFTGVKGVKNIVRAAYIRFGGGNDDDIHVDIGLDAAPFNTILPPTQSDMNALYNYIRTLPCHTNVTGNVNLDGALTEAYNQFDNIGASDNDGRDKKIIIISNNYLSEPQQNILCTNHASKIRTGMDIPSNNQHDVRGINVIMVNLGSDVFNHNNYIMCLVEFDKQRIFEEEHIKFNPDLEFLVPEIRNELCSAPTPSPTIDPTRDPTREPTDFPTDFPSDNPTIDPTNEPTGAPTESPTNYPSVPPSEYPTRDPTTNPTPWPTGAPTQSPTDYPTISPTADPTSFPTDFPTDNPTDFPTDNPTLQPTTSPTALACELFESFEFAIVVDNSCGLNYNECLIQRDQIAELLSMLKADNAVDNPKVTYIEYNAIGANVRVSLDNPLQANTRMFYNFIRSHAVCGDGGDGNTDLLSGLQLALNEFNMHGNPNAIQKIITINNCANQQINTTNYDDSNDTPPQTYTQDAIICSDIVNEMNALNIDGYVINIPAPQLRAQNSILNEGEYLSCLTDDDTNRIYSGGHHSHTTITHQEYNNALRTCITALCSEPTTSPTIQPTRDPTSDPTTWPTPEPTPHPTGAPTDMPSVSPTVDPTSFPTDFPTDNPTFNPTRDPTTNPTTQPTRDPTEFPSPFPTQRPSPQPTHLPTPSPNMAACENGGRLDIVFLIDTSISNEEISDDECESQGEFIAELYTSVKGEANIVRAAYIRFDSATQHIDVALNAEPYNKRDVKPQQSDMNILYNFIRDQSCSTEPQSPSESESSQEQESEYGINNLHGALQAAYRQFDDIGESDGSEYNGDTYPQRDKKIVIVSNNYLNQQQQDDICAENKDKIRTGLYQNQMHITNGVNGINVIMINLRRNNIIDTYIMCLVEYDPNRIYTAPIVNYYPELHDLIPTVRDEVCSAPTPAPTVDPTRDPTIEPTPWPTPNPTASPSESPTDYPTISPTADPTSFPTDFPTDNPTTQPTRDPTNQPTRDPTHVPTTDPTFNPTSSPTTAPSASPTPRPTRWPTKPPTLKPTEWPTPAPTPGPTMQPTKSPTQSPTNVACTLHHIYEFAIVVDNSCGLTMDECDLQMDQIAELYSLMKKDNPIDNPKVTYIEYGESGANVRVSLDNPLQANTLHFYNFIRQNGNCGGGGNGQTDLVSGIDVALNEFNVHGNPNAIKKIITINNCKNTMNDEEICNRIMYHMTDNNMDGVVINMPAPNAPHRASNVISTQEMHEYLSCFANNNICTPDMHNNNSMQYDSGEMLQNEYNYAYSQCLPIICEDANATLSPTQTKHPTEFQWPTPQPTQIPTIQPSENPSSAPTKMWWTHSTTQVPSKWPTNEPTSANPTIAITTTKPTAIPTKWPTTYNPTIATTTTTTITPSKWPTKEPTPMPTPNPTTRPTPQPIFTTTLNPTIQCPVCLADMDDDDINVYDDNGYFADPKPPKDMIFTSHSVASNINHNRDASILNTNHNNKKGNGDYSSWTYFIVLSIVSCNLIFCLSFVLKSNKKEMLLGYIAGQQNNNTKKIPPITEADISDSEDDEYEYDDDINDEYQTSADELD